MKDKLLFLVILLFVLILLGGCAFSSYRRMEITSMGPGYYEHTVIDNRPLIVYEPYYVVRPAPIIVVPQEKKVHHHRRYYNRDIIVVP